MGRCVRRRTTFVLSDGRELSAPTTWPRRLSSAKADDRAKWEIGGTGTNVDWPTIDEHIGVWTMLGVPEEEVLEAAGFEMERLRTL